MALVRTKQQEINEKRGGKYSQNSEKKEKKTQQPNDRLRMRLALHLTMAVKTVISLRLPSIDSGCH